MPVRYNYIHACGHIGIGPIAILQPNNLLEPCRTHKLTLDHPFACPFCNTKVTKYPVSLSPGSGLLCNLTTPSPPYSTHWHILHACALSAVTPHDWSLATTAPDGAFRHAAWIPRPEGEVRVLNGHVVIEEDETTESGVVTQVSSVRKEKWNRGMVGSRMAGLVSQLVAAVRSGEVAGRYEV